MTGGPDLFYAPVMKKLIPVLLLVVAAAVLFLVPRGDRDGRPEILFSGLLEDAAHRPDPGVLGPAWPTEEAMETLQEEWRELDPADSAVFAQLTSDWIYRESVGPNRITNVTQIRAGRDLVLEDRLRLAQLLAEHPGWRLGSMRHYPAVTPFLTADEKSVLLALARGGSAEPRTAARVAAGSGMSPPLAVATLDGLASVGWVVGADSAGYVLADPRMADGGALNFLTFSPNQGRAFDVVSIEAALRHHADAFRNGRVKLIGNCVQTGRPVLIDVVAGRLSAGRPGAAVAVTAKPEGSTTGVFASRRALQTWKELHPGVETSDGLAVPAFFHDMMAES